MGVAVKREILLRPRPLRYDAETSWAWPVGQGASAHRVWGVTEILFFATYETFVGPSFGRPWAYRKLFVLYGN